MITQQPVLVRNLPVPPELQHAIDQTVEVCKIRGRRRRQDAEEYLKLRYHYGGKVVATVVTPEGLAVYSDVDFHALSDSLPKRGRGRPRFNIPDPLDMSHFPE